MAKWFIQASWDDAPHLTDTMKQDMLDQLLPHQKMARSRGIPMLGSGAIYPVFEDRFLVEDFEIPSWWPRCYGLDVGWNRTAAVWGATDPQTETTFLYCEYYVSQAEPASHAVGIRAPGSWIPGVIDPASRGRSQFDGEQMIRTYRELGLDIVPADNAVEAGISKVFLMLTSGKLKVFRTLQRWLNEVRGYHRDDRGKVVKEFDHLMDATRYLVMSGLKRAISLEDWEHRFDDQETTYSAIHQYGRSAVTGY